MNGNITRRGKASWRLKFEAGERDQTGKRRTQYVTIRGTRKDAQIALTRLLVQRDDGIAINPSKTTLAEYLRGWLDNAEGLAGKTRERYRQLAEQQIISHLGGIALQKLRPADIANWHGVLLRRGGQGGRPLSPRTAGHAHRVLHTALARAVKVEIIPRNVAALVRPPKVEAREVQILDSQQINTVLRALEGHSLSPVVTVAVGTGMRRGEICALRWGDVDLDAGTIRVNRSLEETASGLRVKPPKSRHGKRMISIPHSAADALRAHWLRQTELRLALGMGRLSSNDSVFTRLDGRPLSPDNLSRDWRRTVLALKLPTVMFHSLRHSHASTLVAAGVDVLTISRRLGHGSPAFTLTVYGHLFAHTDQAAARAIDVALGGS
jgi:integrase